MSTCSLHPYTYPLVRLGSSPSVFPYSSLSSTPGILWPISEILGKGLRARVRQDSTVRLSNYGSDPVGLLILRPVVPVVWGAVITEIMSYYLIGNQP